MHSELPKSHDNSSGNLSPTSNPHKKRSAPPGFLRPTVPRTLCPKYHSYETNTYKPNNILGNFKIEIQKKSCHLQISLADTLYSGKTFDLSFQGNNVQKTTVPQNLENV